MLLVYSDIGIFSFPGQIGKFKEFSALFLQYNSISKTYPVSAITDVDIILSNFAVLSNLIYAYGDG